MDGDFDPEIATSDEEGIDDYLEEDQSPESRAS
jgi:hypothetical protein